MKAKSDPKVRKDGRCALASCRKPRTITKQAEKYAPGQAVADPFCSTGCAREWHGVR